MKKIRFLTALVLVGALCLVGILTACNDKNSELGTYYAVKSDGSLDKSSYIELQKKNKWTDGEDSGTYEINDGEIVLYEDGEAVLVGTVSDGVMLLTLMGMPVGVFCKEGATIPSSSLPGGGNTGNNGNNNNNNSGNNGGNNNDNNGGNTPQPEITKYTVRFDSNGGTSVSSVQVPENTKMTAPSNPTKDGYTFAGWFVDSKCTEAWDFSTRAVSDNMTLYAGWTAESGRIIAVENASIDGLDILLVVNEETEYVSLSGALTIGGNATWKL